jgi:ATP-binding cassette subfamily C protein LapB
VGESGGIAALGRPAPAGGAGALPGHRPQILLMDEPTSSMDAQSELAFLRQLKDGPAAARWSW